MVRKYALISLIGIGTAVLCFGMFFAMTPTTNHLSDALIFGSAGVFLALSLVISRTSLKPIGVGVVCVELIICVWLLIDALKHLHTL